jgi:hypothetical protein
MRYTLGSRSLNVSSLRWRNEADKFHLQEDGNQKNIDAP